MKSHPTRYWLFAACLAVTGCADTSFGGNSQLAKQAKALVGQNVQLAVQQFGKPKFVIPKQALYSKVPGAYAEYDWSEFHPSQKVDFIQTGSQYVGSDIVGMTQASPGVGSEPIYQDQYVATGYYKRETDGCVLKITVDERGTILATTVFGTTCK